MFKTAAVFFLAGAMFGAETIPANNGVIAHEWGTFTSVASLSGYPMIWYALGGPAKLPCFVHTSELLTKGSAAATVRMETPVVYFYSPRKITMSVSVSFPAGSLTEWYPDVQNKYSLQRLDWPAVQVLPGEDLTLPSGQGGNHYYAARATDSAPLRVGKEQEKLLFYRGVGNPAVLIRPKFTAEGKIELRSIAGDAIPAAMVFENRGGRIGYRVVRDLRGTATVDAPELSGAAADLRGALAGELARAGLYPKEAQAMLETWRDSWFEEGMRVMYILPRSAVDAALPLKLDPPPVEMARVFVGRIEMLSPAMTEEIEGAAKSGDRKVLAKYGRFLQPFWEELYRMRGSVAARIPAGVVAGETGGCAQ
jgi:hypothetical protein